METMPRPRPQYLHREISRHGKPVWYVRVGKGPRIRLQKPYGSPEFDAEYRDAIAGKRAPANAAPAAGSIAWLIEQYRETAEWQSLSLATRRLRENVFKPILATAGNRKAAAVIRDDIEEGVARRASRAPSSVKHYLTAMRGLFRWAKKAKHVAVDPTAGVASTYRQDGHGFIPWTEEHVAAYEAKWPIGTRQRVWLDVLLYTGLRRGDAVRLGRQHVRDKVATITTEKTDTIVTLPILPVLAVTLKAGPCGDLAFIAGERGQPLTKESFGNLFREACRDAKVPGSAHGVRKIAATRAANAGATVAELEAIFGWQGGAMASLYTRAADRKRLAERAMHKLGNSIPAPTDQVRASKQKRK